VDIAEKRRGNLRQKVEDTMAENWTELAPAPEPLAQGKTWHVFFSYRSVGRPWVLALYDILNGLGYKVFLDQYVLTAAAPLALSLGDALDTSQSAILVWSGKYEDSEWCKKEAATLEVLENAGNGFRYVIARIDDSKIKGLPAAKLWVDFSKQPEGPGGSGLLSLLYGLQGKPLPRAAVQLAAKVDEEMQDGLLSVKACREAGDADGLVELTATDDPAWTGSPMLLCATAEGLIAMKKVTEALKVLDRVGMAFPKALRPKQLRGLALARSGETMKAQLVLGKLYAAGEIDPETLGILARTWMDRYNQTHEKTFLLKSRDLYRQAFEAFPTDYYTGINAASKSLLAGEKETAAQLATRVQGIVGDKAVPDDYWRTATIAEVQLLQGNFDAAASLYNAAVLTAPLDHGSHDSSYRQAQLLLAAHDATNEQKAKIAAAFPYLASA
jgi:TIR domain/MAP3K TRAFs-binding domain